MKMMKNISVLFLAFTTLFLAACAPTPPPLGQYYQPESLLPADYARVYVYRPSSILNQKVWPNITFNGTSVAALPDGAYTSVLVKPGHYAIATASSKTDDTFMMQTDLKAVAGKTYYVALIQNVKKQHGMAAFISIVQNNGTGKNHGNVVSGTYFGSVPENLALAKLSECRYLAPMVAKVDGSAAFSASAPAY